MPVSFTRLKYQVLVINLPYPAVYDRALFPRNMERKIRKAVRAVRLKS